MPLTMIEVIQTDLESIRKRLSEIEVTLWKLLDEKHELKTKMLRMQGESQAGSARKVE